MTKFDGIVEAVRYKAGRIDVVRAYERRGPTFSDHVLLDRPALLRRLKAGKRFMTGQRKEFLASTFDVGKPINLVGVNSTAVVTTMAQGAQDHLEGVPAF